MDKLFEKFIASEVYTKIKPLDTIAFYIGGSRLINCDDTKSDVDLVFLTLNSEYHISKFIDHNHIIYTDENDNTIFMHWYYWPIKNFLNYLFENFADKTNQGYNICSIVILPFLDASKILDFTPKYKILLEYLLKEKNNLGYLGCRLMYEFYKKDINKSIENNQIIFPKLPDRKDLSKVIYKICLSCDWLYQRPIDTEFLKRIKRINKKPVSKEDEQLAIKKVTEFKAYIESHPINVEAYVSKFNFEVDQLCRQLKI